MKKCVVFAAMMAALSIPPLAAAGKDNDPKAQPQAEKKVAEFTDLTKPELPPAASFEVKALTVIKDPKAQPNEQKKDAATTTDAAKGKTPPEFGLELKTLKLGKVITVGPDGKSFILEFRGEPPKEVLDKLPKDIREKIQKEGPRWIVPGGENLVISGKVVVESNGKRQELVLPDLRGSDLRRRYAVDFEEFLRKAGDKLPAEPKQALEAVAQAMNAQEREAVMQASKAQEAVAQAVKAQEAFAQAVKAQQQEAVVQAARAQEAIARAVKARDQLYGGRAKAADDINAKLDKILDRLERMDKELQAIKAKHEE
jgi:hypothetical protein